MKHIFNKPETSELLKEWCPRAPLQTKSDNGPAYRLIIASYFFWINGDSTQRSQEGLLRSILFDIFSKYPEHVSMLEPFQSDDSGSTTTTPWSWTFESCLNVFEAVLRHTRRTDKYCLFIDGLDELKVTIRNWSTLSNISESFRI